VKAGVGVAAPKDGGCEWTGGQGRAAHALRSPASFATADVHSCEQLTTSVSSTAVRSSSIVRDSFPNEAKVIIRL